MLLVCSVVASGKSSNTAKAEKLIGYGKTVAIDPGCQANEDSRKEALGPGDFKRVKEDLVGTTGVTTDYPEYELNLQVALKLKSVLEKNGYKVILTRTESDIYATNVDRTMIANTTGADIYVSIHANDTEDTGVQTYCMTEDNPYNYGNYGACRLLSDVVVSCLADETKADNNGVIETDKIVGINWCSIPNTVVGIGSLENEEEEALLVTDEYQSKIATGIAAGIDSYFTQK